jgi:succinate dehydrogenase hydrophobic anchor subunit
VAIPLMFIGGAFWFAEATSESREWPGRFLLIAFILAIAHLVAGIVWNTAVPEYHRPKGTGKIMIGMFIVLLLVGILMPALGRC